MGACPAVRADQMQVAEPGLGVGAGARCEGARRRDHVLERPLGLLADRGRELCGGQQRLEHRRDAGVLGEVDLGEPVDEGRGRGVGDEAHGQLGRDAPRGLRVAGEVGEVLDPHALAVRGGVGVGPAEHGERAAVVPDRPVEVLARLLLGRHAGQDQGRAPDVRLEVAPVDPDGVQLEHLATEVLVRGPLRRRLVVELGEHGGVLRRGHEHVGVAAEGVLAHDVDVEAVHGIPRLTPGGGHDEVVGPEVDHDLEQLSARPQRSRDVRLDDVVAEVTGAVRPVLVVHLPGPQRQPRPLRRHERVDGGVRHLGEGVELGVDPRRHPDLADLGDEGGCRAPARAAGEVEGRGHRGRRRRGAAGRRGGLGRGGGPHGAHGARCVGGVDGRRPRGLQRHRLGVELGVLARLVGLDGLGGGRGGGCSTGVPTAGTRGWVSRSRRRRPRGRRRPIGGGVQGTRAPCWPPAEAPGRPNGPTSMVPTGRVRAFLTRS